MIPLRDVIPSRTTPYITVTIIVLNALAWLFELTLPHEQLNDFLTVYGVVPAYLSWPTLITSMFLHGSWSHVIGNMWYLWIFGDNVEDRLGHVRFLLFYLLAGVAASTLQYVLNPGAQVPTVGASGAIAGVLGAYLVAFPHARVVTLIPFFPFFQVIALPAVLVLGLWFVFQFFSGFLSLGWSAAGGGVAWWAHVGGFGFGVLVMNLLGGVRRSRAWVE
jgi:membrane associated rhomboid family serine protease